MYKFTGFDSIKPPRGKEKDFYWGSFGPMMAVQVTSIFIDYAFKTTAVMAAFSMLGNDSYANQTAFIALLGVACTLPFVFFGGLAGYVCDRFRKRNIMLLSKIAELFFLILAFFAVMFVDTFGTSPILLCAFLLALQSAFLSPAYYGLIPERFGEQGASVANGYSQMFSSMAVIAGGATGFFLPWGIGCGPAIAVYTVFSIGGIIAAALLSCRGPNNQQLKFSWHYLLSQFKSLHTIRKKNKILFLGMVGDAYFCALSTVVLSIIVIFVINHFNVPETDGISLAFSQIPLGLGVGLGSFAAGKISGKRIEGGLIPYGVFGMAIALLLIPLCPGGTFAMGSIILAPLFMTWLFLLGFSGGFMVVPIRAFVQCRASPKHRGEILAAENVLCFAAMLLCMVIVFFLTSGIAPTEKGLWIGTVEWAQRNSLTWDTTYIFYALALWSLIMLCIAFIKTPDMTLRFLVVVITRFIYKIHRMGPGIIPDQGPVLLMANHVSFVDGLLLSTLTRRPVRFLMNQDYYRSKWLRLFAKLGRFIEVPNNVTSQEGLRTLFKNVQQALSAGEIVCIFPEGRLTRNGVICRFQAGYKHMIPEGMKVPIIPVHIGMIYGSMFSRCYGDGKVRLQFNNRLPYPMTLYVGNPVDPAETSPFKLRQAIAEFGAEAEMEPRPEERTLHYRFSKGAARFPFRRVVNDNTGKSFKNYELWVGAALLSKELRKLEKGQYIAVLMPNCAPMAMVLLGVLLADKIPAILNFTASPDAMHASLNHVGNPIILTSKKFISKLKWYPTENLIYLEDIVPRIKKYQKLTYLFRLLFCPIQSVVKGLAPKTHRNVKGVGVVIFSSGSSGTPKAVQLTHHNLNADTNGMVIMMGLRRSDMFIGALPLFHSYGFTTGFWMPMTVFCKVVYIPNPLEVSTIGDTLVKYNVTLLLGTPTFLQAYYRRVTPEQMSTVRLVIAGGEKLRKEFADAFGEKYGLAPMEGFGATELSPVVTVNIGDSLPDRTRSVGKPGSIGVALPNLSVKIVDINTMEECPPGTEGLMMVKGPVVMKGYLNEPERTADVLKNGWYNTGDIAHMDEEGYIFITGRFSRFSKIGGEMVPHEKVEQLLLDYSGNPDDRSLAVTSAPDPTKGERLIVFYNDHLHATPQECVEWLRTQNIPNIWIPKAQDFIAIEKIPILGTGKLDLFGLKAHVNKLLIEQKNTEKK